MSDLSGGLFGIQFSTGYQLTQSPTLLEANHAGNVENSIQSMSEAHARKFSNSFGSLHSLECPVITTGIVLGILSDLYLEGIRPKRFRATSVK